MDASYLDRQAVEQLFGVGERRARQLMGMPPDGLKSPPRGPALPSQYRASS